MKIAQRIKQGRLTAGRRSCGRASRLQHFGGKTHKIAHRGRIRVSPLGPGKQIPVDWQIHDGCGMTYTMTEDSAIDARRAVSDSIGAAWITMMV
ncbi:hypothetical protein CY34DRAFT_811275 [Suillus luteus UH-Slu-Lm8-n1]|uniref:Uncharacterized protein n=1 Tax=Suillus luteus UH-Slu-Lm8-n1 TaxID=930992 RepID=A0A0C9ZGA7_9AGAM|nr:hypothetical protein CY34DRAFT_811275 [Suillus luteus UH-Slu-Lm8-n1]